MSDKKQPWRNRPKKQYVKKKRSDDMMKVSFGFLMKLKKSPLER